MIDNQFIYFSIFYYYSDIFEFHKAPFSESLDDNSDSSDSEAMPENAVKKITLDEFQQLSSLSFQNFKEELKVCIRLEDHSFSLG
jgi:hypothetical protein